MCLKHLQVHFLPPPLTLHSSPSLPSASVSTFHDHGATDLALGQTQKALLSLGPTETIDAKQVLRPGPDATCACPAHTPAHLSCSAPGSPALRLPFTDRVCPRWSENSCGAALLKKSRIHVHPQESGSWRCCKFLPECFKRDHFLPWHFSPSWLLGPYGCKTMSGKAAQATPRPSR